MRHAGGPGPADHVLLQAFVNFGFNLIDPGWSYGPPIDTYQLQRPEATPRAGTNAAKSLPGPERGFYFCLYFFLLRFGVSEEKREGDSYPHFAGGFFIFSLQRKSSVS
jgi:hypothetical protein